MPVTMLQNRRFDARPDRIDYRDRLYNPPLVSLPEQSPDPEFIAEHLPSYTGNGLILDQGKWVTKSFANPAQQSIGPGGAT